MHALYYPMFVSLLDRVCLVVGGGAVAERKVRVLCEHGATIHLVAQTITGRLEEQCQEGRIHLVGRTYEDSQLEGVDLVFAATNEASLNRKIAEDARRRKIWCNMATEPELGSFIVPSIFRKGPLTISISTAGVSPALAKRIREKLEGEFDTGWIFFLTLMGLLRKRIQEKGLGTAENQRLFRLLAGLPIPEWTGEREQAIAAIHEVCRPWLELEELNQTWNQAWQPFS
jgi:precorrin-2 dehydrogenase / sirohydrochlorin ferrochelatase